VLPVVGFFLWPRPLRIRTSPPGAEINLDGKTVGVSPYDGTVSFGTHRLVISKEGYDTVANAIDSGDGTMELTLQPFTTWVDLLTLPPGATATLGDHPLGSTPRKGLLVPDRPVTLVITLHGYKRWEGTLGPGHRPPSPIVLVRETR
jgi:hypothetical protein